MKVLRRRLYALTLAGALSIALLVGCGDRTRAPDETTIGVLTDLSSFTAEYGRQELAGLEILAEQRTADGHPTRVLSQDTKGTARDGVNAFSQLASGSTPPDLLFVALSSVSVAVLPEAQERNLLSLSNATTAAVTEVSPLAIRNFPDPTQELQNLYDGAVTPLGLQRVGMIYINDEYGQSMSTLFTQRAASTPPLNEGYGFEASDFRSTAARAISARLDGVIVIGYGSQAGNLIRQLRESGYRGRILVPSLIVNTDSVATAAGNALEGVIYNGFDYQNDDPRLSTLLARFVEKYEGRQSDIGILAYVGANILLEHAVEGDASATIAALERAQPFDTVLGSVRLQNRTLVYQLHLYEVRQGQPVAFAAP